MNESDRQEVKNAAGCNAVIALLLAIAVAFMFTAGVNQRLRREIKALEARIEALEQRK